MRDWSVIFTGTKDGKPKYDNIKVHIGDIQDLMGVAKGTVSIRVPLNPLQQDEIEDALTTWRRVIWVLCDGVPWFAGIIPHTNQFTESDTDISFTASRADVIWTKRQIWSTMAYFNIDQNLIMRNLMLYGMGLPPIHCDPYWMERIDLLPHAQLPWIRLDNSYSGVLRIRENNADGYQGSRGMSIAEALSNLTQVIGGPEYRISYHRDPDGSLYIVPELGTPTFGRDHPVPIERPIGFTEAVDSDDTENMSRIVGAAPDDATLEEEIRKEYPNWTPEEIRIELAIRKENRVIGKYALDEEALAGNWPLLMGQETSSSFSQEILDLGSKARLEIFKGENRGWAIKFSLDTLGKIDFGDVLSPVIVHSRWPNGLYLPPQRAIGHKIQPDENLLTPMFVAA